MTEPIRLRDSSGPARALMRGSGLPVPSASRRRALAFTAAAAANVAAGGTALAAGGVSLVKSVALCVSLGVVGGGLASLGVSSAVSSLEAPAQPATASLGKPSIAARPATAAAPSAARAEPDASPPEADPEPSPMKEPSLAKASASAPLSAASAARPTLFDEQRLIESARAAMARGDAVSGLKTLDGYERSFPRGQFHPEALALRVEGVASRGDLVRARTLADAFARRYPQHPLLARVQASVGR